MQMKTETENKRETTRKNAKGRGRLSEEQVRCLERSFAEEEKLPPKRKEELAEELQLHPRQVAVWFQNRRARSKVSLLQHSHQCLSLRCDSLVADNAQLRFQVAKLTKELQDAVRVAAGKCTCTSTTTTASASTSISTSKDKDVVVIDENEHEREIDMEMEVEMQINMMAPYVESCYLFYHDQEQQLLQPFVCRDDLFTRL